jgi:hypothetical protein
MIADNMIPKGIAAPTPATVQCYVEAEKPASDGDKLLMMRVPETSEFSAGYWLVFQSEPRFALVRTSDVNIALQIWQDVQRGLPLMEIQAKDYA